MSTSGSPVTALVPKDAKSRALLSIILASMIQAKRERQHEEQQSSEQQQIAA